MATVEEVEEKVLRSIISVTSLIMDTVSAPFLDAIRQNTMAAQEEIR